MFPAVDTSVNQNMNQYMIFDDYNSNYNPQNPQLSANQSIVNGHSRSKEMNKPRGRRVSLNEDEKRAEHNAIERARRECLNYKFRVLAKALPNLQNFRRPSKGQIVEKALDWVKQALAKEDQYQYRIMQLENENRKLVSQLQEIHEFQNKPTAHTSAPTSSTTTLTSSFSPSGNYPSDVSHMCPPINEPYADWTQYQQNPHMMESLTSTPTLSGSDEEVSSNSSTSYEDIQLLLNDLSQETDPDVKNNEVFNLETNPIYPSNLMFY